MFEKKIKESFQVCPQESFKGVLQMCPNKKKKRKKKVSKKFLKCAQTKTICQKTFQRSTSRVPQKKNGKKKV
jgi:hypothetical protein